MIYMGKVKNILIDEMHENWVEEQQRKRVYAANNEAGIMYNDLIDMDLLFDEDIESIGLAFIDNDTYKIVKIDEILEINAVSIKFKKFVGEVANGSRHRIYIIPFDKLLYVAYNTYPLRSASK